MGQRILSDTGLVSLQSVYSSELFKRRSRGSDPNETEVSYQEKRACLIEELDDVLDNLFILTDKYDISIEEVIEKHQAKFIKRYVKEG